METELVEIYVALLDEGTDCWRPTMGEPVGEGTYKLLPTPNYDPEDETWEFLPGTIVRCEWEEKWRGSMRVRSLIAKEAYSPED